jgi:LPXTG-motif cell wall-anchored protein
MHNEKIDVPQTGDFRTSNSFWIVLGGVAAVGIAVCVVLFLRKKKRISKEAE